MEKSTNLVDSSSPCPYWETITGIIAAVGSMVAKKIILLIRDGMFVNSKMKYVISGRREHLTSPDSKTNRSRNNDEGLLL